MEYRVRKFSLYGGDKQQHVEIALKQLTSEGFHISSVVATEHNIIYTLQKE